MSKHKMDSCLHCHMYRKLYEGDDYRDYCDEMDCTVDVSEPACNYY